MEYMGARRYEQQPSEGHRLVEAVFMHNKFIDTTEATSDPKRCRAVIVSPSGSHMVVIRRKRPGQEPYAVLPGGGLEEQDASPIDGVRRELSEELSIGDADVDIDECRVISLPDDQWVYFGTSRPNALNTLAISGPEAGRDPAISGTYEPVWVSLADMDMENVVPIEIRKALQRAMGAE